MAKVFFTAWKNKSQLLDVRGEFYPPPAYEGPDMRSHACATVEAWKLRGNVPHHVEATALLTDAILHDDAQRNSIFSIRATYSAAFCRFVTGLVDTKIHGQRKTMFQRAVDLGLPASFVELRHEATHREPPSLVVLRKATQRSLEWLWDTYWAEIDDLEAVSAVEHRDSSSVRSALVDVLQQFSADARSTEPMQKKRKRDHAASVAANLLSVCGASSEGLRLLPVVLLDESGMIDSERTVGDPLKGTFDKWDPVLLNITEHRPSFVMYLTEELVHRLVFDTGNDASQSSSAEALFLWLTHILTSTTWESRRPLCPTSYIRGACKENPSHWAQMLEEKLQQQAITNTATSRTRSTFQTRSRDSAPRNGSDVSLSASDKLREHGWAPVEKWDSRPLGIASTS
ncbi:uncharacterized protein N7459_003201 [Penicillium hispanicum]|uniref:uncharacterized protein n=1 Tax=Penicillium hispanicum TaxID=1080232 RepID=UPI0025401315|nr:uncharacterized protein N7459_003201 [Penicillium hispanicum]KAJ5587436.1 hypothetical protein N7459_003201 [Penicillium hispanicum]